VIAMLRMQFSKKCFDFNGRPLRSVRIAFTNNGGHRWEDVALFCPTCVCIFVISMLSATNVPRRFSQCRLWWLIVSILLHSTYAVTTLHSVAVASSVTKTSPHSQTGGRGRRLKSASARNNEANDINENPDSAVKLYVNDIKNIVHDLSNSSFKENYTTTTDNGYKSLQSIDIESAEVGVVAATLVFIFLCLLCFLLRCMCGIIFCDTCCHRGYVRIG
jgi:hypothetical protein